VALTLRTDQPEERLRSGAVFAVGVAGRERTLTVASTRAHQGRWYVRFEEVTDRTDAESLRGIDLQIDVDAQQDADEDPDAWDPAQLKGLSVQHVDGRELGTVAGLDHYPAQDRLLVRTPARRRVQLPLVEELVPEVD